MSAERPGAVTFKGQPLTLVGPELKPGDKAPDFTIIDQSLQPASLKDYAGKIVLLSVVPSLDTSICSAQTKRFNEEAAKLPEDVAILTISMDLPFAQARFCGAENIDRVKVLSDHRDASFAQAYGTLVKELRLESRAIFVIDRDGTIRYVEYVPEIASHPNYDAALEAVKALL
ncbi:MAG: thiol peroxidase [Acidobacteria bacterium]|nr:thiol peroxidase [Acidobacteriota bacterium]MDW7985576.1 thiol peroxidase [Acidobacteriota bacterium]